MSPICATNHAAAARLEPHVHQRLTPIMTLQINVTTRGGSDASLPELPRRSDPDEMGRMHECTTMNSDASGREV